ncbi:Glycine cleavage system transcriptional activator [Pandoraea terrae]|uniref:Glycine cleavage system transcriptional activator n=1 Tax=Pandoraea terrae TaxID=1537710 RepID=A0A5E4TII5_9BURK|nr:LysR substrate-binding domain-containing protein [Pandoraea terrae]VVD87707.1 Glycine cleavage system transcriptional activator [Pandoraea terrae]
MRLLPPLNALQVFEIVARYRSFTRAAEHLCLTQGAVSRQILSLENYYQLPLFERRAKGLTLTPEGERLLPAVKEGLACIEEASIRLKRQTPDLALKVPTCAMHWMLPKIMRFQKEHPGLQMQITTSWQHTVDFESEPYDAAIVYGSSPGRNVHSIRLFDEVLTPVCSPELANGGAIATEADLTRYTLLHPTRDHRDWKRWLDHVGMKSIDVSGGLNFETLDMATSAAVQGLGVAIGDCTLVKEDIEAGRLVMPFEMTVTTGASYYFVHPDNVTTQDKVNRFSEWIATQPLWATDAEHAPARSR